MPNHNPLRSQDRANICRRIDASIYGKIERAEGAERLALCRQEALYVQVSTDEYPAEKIALLLRRAKLRRTEART